MLWDAAGTRPDRHKELEESQVVWKFANFELDEQLFQLRQAGEVQKLEPKTFDLLLYLLHHRDRVVSKDELLDKVWPGQVVSESVLPRNVRVLRQVLGDDRTSQRFIETAHGRGYRFAAEASDAEAATHPGVVAEDVPDEGNPFIGRAQLIEELGASLASARRGRGELTLLAGEPGIGKTRTAEEFSRLASRGGTRVLAGHCYEGDGAPAFWPWIQILRASVHNRDRNLLIAELGAGIRRIYGVLVEVASTGGDSHVSTRVNQ